MIQCKAIDARSKQGLTCHNCEFYPTNLLIMNIFYGIGPLSGKHDLKYLTQDIKFIPTMFSNKNMSYLELNLWRQIVEVNTSMLFTHIFILRMLSNFRFKISG